MGPQGRRKRQGFSPPNRFFSKKAKQKRTLRGAEKRDVFHKELASL